METSTKLNRPRWVKKRKGKPLSPDCKGGKAKKRKKALRKGKEEAWFGSQKSERRPDDKRGTRLEGWRGKSKGEPRSRSSKKKRKERRSRKKKFHRVPKKPKGNCGQRARSPGERGKIYIGKKSAVHVGEVGP